MSEAPLGFWSRLLMFFWVPWKVLFNPAAAAKVQRVLAAPVSEPEGTVPAAPTPTEAAPPPPEAPKTHALHLLAILQRDGRLVDFLQEDIAAVPDAQLGAAARVVHEGCRKAVERYFTLEPIRQEEEGAPVTVPEGFDPVEIRLTGEIKGEPPFAGHLAHPGWRVSELRLPDLPDGIDPHVIAPAEVEV